MVGRTLKIDQNFNSTNATLDNATLLIANQNANNAGIDFKGGDRLILSFMIAADSGLEGIVINDFSYGDRIEIIGASTGGSGTPSLAGGSLSFNIGGTSYQVHVGLVSGAANVSQYGYDSGSGYYYVGLTAPSPTVTITSAAESDASTSRTISGTVTANGSATVAGTTVTLSEGSTARGQATVASDGSFSAQVTLTGQGSHNIVASDTDSLGSVGTSAPVTETVTAATNAQPAGATQTGPAASGAGTMASESTGGGGSPAPSGTDSGPPPVATGYNGLSSSPTQPGPAVPAPATRTTPDDPASTVPPTSSRPQTSPPSIAFNGAVSVRGAIAHLTSTRSAWLRTASPASVRR